MTAPRKNTVRDREPSVVVLDDDEVETDSFVSAWAERLTLLLDDGLRVPGTRLRFGLDPILGLLLPGVGDSLTGLSAIAILWLALKRRVPTVVLLRMLVNIGIDTAVGLVPAVGDVFDLFYKANRRNLDLLRKYEANPAARPSASDYLVVGLGMLLAIAGAVLPWVLLYWLGTSLWDAIGR